MLLRRTRSRQMFRVQIDPEDLDLVNQYEHWHLRPRRNGGFFAATTVRDDFGYQHVILMHRLIMPGHLRVIHKNGNTLDNRRKNLRGVG